MAHKFILYNVKEGVATITFNRPEKRNAINWPMRKEIVGALKESEANDDVKVVIIKGAGTAFCSGYDISPVPPGKPHLLESPTGVVVSKKLDRLAGMSAMSLLADWRTIWDLLKPVIAQVHGYCLAGGWELAAMCDLRIVAEDAQIGSPIQRVIGVGHLHHHPWILGLTKAKEMLLTGHAMSGAEAVEWGWANHAYPKDKLDEEVFALAQRMATIPSEVLMLSKRACNRSMEIMGMQTSIDCMVDLFTLQSLRPGGEDFFDRSREVGLKAALEERDTPFADFRATRRRTTSRKQ